MKAVNKFLFVLLITVGIFQIQGCFFVKAYSGDGDSNLSILNETQTELFFGLSKPDGTSVTKDEWNKFVDDYISPKFIEGFTIVDSYGQWTDIDHNIMKENSMLVIIIYKRSPEMDSSISYVINNYKRLFQQGSVLNVSFPVSVEE
jgi:hypothetical protein